MWRECRQPSSWNFNPHSPCGERPVTSNLSNVTNQFQSTLPLRGATFFAAVCFAVNLISIHTPLAGSDSPSLTTEVVTAYFNPHSPCGERRDEGPVSGAAFDISIHTPLAGSDDSLSFPRPNPSRFQSTLPLRGATDFWRMLWRRTNFNPHSPCGERHPQHRSGRRRTEISIHTPLAGSDGTVGWLRFGRRYFNPHSPCGERRTARPCGSRVTEISIHTPLAGSDLDGAEFGAFGVISIHTPLAGSDKRHGGLHR